MSGGSKSKNKGSGAERALALILSEVFGKKFIRSASSGAYLGGTNIFRKNGLSSGQISNLKSDICPPDELRHIVVESKFYASFAFHQLFDENKQLDEWIAQVLVGVDPGDIWMVAIKINRLGWFICTPFDIKYILKNHFIYDSKYGKMIVSQLLPFLKDNQHILEIKPE